MSEMTRQEVLAKKRGRYTRAGKEHKGKILDEVVELFGCHRKVAIQAMRSEAGVVAPYIPGRPKECDPEKLLPPLKAIRLAPPQPCGTRLKACLPGGLPAYEEDHRRLLAASRANLDRLLIPARIAHRRRAATRPGSLLRAEIPIRTEWSENAPGYLDLDTVALCGGSLDDHHSWMLDAVDIHTGWSVLSGLPNRGEASVCGQMDDLRAGLPFLLRGIDSDHGGEFINHQRVRYCAGLEPPVAFTRSRPYKKNDQAHIEQTNYTHVRLWFGYERYDGPEVWPLNNALCRGPLNRLFNWFLPTMKLAKKERVGSKVVRRYGPTQTPLDRVLACTEVSAETKARLRADKAAQNPFALRREVDLQMNTIDAARRAPGACPRAGDGTEIQNPRNGSQGGWPG